MKVAELTGPQLDYWAGKANGEDVFLHDTVTGQQACSVRDPSLWTECRNYSPSTDWNVGGPIIEREGISSEHVEDIEYGGGDTWKCCKKDYVQQGHTFSMKDCHTHCDDSNLIAAMRCYVASKFGEEVPDE